MTTGAAAFAAPHLLPPKASAIDDPYAPVKVSADRVMRTVVGLRPYRPTGFVLKRERIGRRTVVHNYGHGGCGVTLSWGCAQRAAALAAAADGRRAVVLGAGVMGLTTAMLLVRQGYQVTVYGADLPPHTTSNIAGAFWQPSTLYDEAKVDDAFMAAFRDVARASHRAFLHYVNNPYYGVWWIRLLELEKQASSAPAAERPEGSDLYPGAAAVSDPTRYFGYGRVVRYRSLMIDPDIFLFALMRDIESAGGRIAQRRFERTGEVADLDC
ncbi:MAG: FAD-dependent oxidoreductase, partial [Pseudomonadota bacterium]